MADTRNGPSKRSRVKLDQTERRRLVAQYRRAGCTINEICDKVGASKSTVIRDLDHLLTTLRAEALQDLDGWVSAQLSELQKVRDTVWDTIRETHPDEVPRGPLLTQSAKVQEREAKLLGLEQTVAAGPTFVIDDERAKQILAEMGLE